MREPQKTYIEISTTSIIKVLLVLFLLWFLYMTRDIVLIVFIALLLASLLEPFVSWMRQRGVPPGASVLLVYIGMFGVLGLIISLLINPISTQTTQLIETFSRQWGHLTQLPALEAVRERYDLTNAVQRAIEFIQTGFSSASGNVVSKVTGFFGGLVSFFVVLVITFYLLSEESALKRILRSIVPVQVQPYLFRLFSRVQDKLGLWLRGQLVLSSIIFALVFVGLSLLQVKYALVLALIAGLMEFIPYIGPMFAAFIAVFLTVFQSPLKALFILILYVVIQQIENHILVPKVMQKAVGLNPVVSIIALLIGARLGGVIGVILAIPVVTALSVFITDFIDAESAKEPVLPHDAH